MEPVILNHPLIKHKLTIMRDKTTGTKEFRELISEVSMMLLYESLKDVKLVEKEIETPLKKMTGYVIDENKMAFIPILRAGTGMLDGLVKVIPNAKIGHIGLYRDEETLKPIKYYYKVPKDISKRIIYVLDPMLATGGSAIDAIDLIKEDAKNKDLKIKFLCIVAAPEGIKALQEKHPDVEIYAAAVDEKLNSHGYILPGLGDAGDRIFGTK